MSIKPFPTQRMSSIFLSFLLIAFAIIPLSVSCSAFGGGLSDDEALKLLRELAVGGKLPPESAVLDIENKFPRSKVGALAKLMRARIRFENRDFIGAADILDSRIFADHTQIADYALWLRGKSLQASGDHKKAVMVLKSLIDGKNESLITSDARVAWSNSALEIGLAGDVPSVLGPLTDAGSPEAILLTAKAWKLTGRTQEALGLFRRAYFSAFGSEVSKQASAYLQEAGESLSARDGEEMRISAESKERAGSQQSALDDYNLLVSSFPDFASASIHLKRLQLSIALKRFPEAVSAFEMIPKGSFEREKAYYELILGNAKSKNWRQARTLSDEMVAAFPNGSLVSKALVDAGLAARDAKMRVEEAFFLKEALRRFPNAVEVAGAQFELAWLEHEAGNFSKASEMLIDHLARYSDRDTTFRGRAGYWAARDSERAGRLFEACVLYEALTYRYSANWYGHLGLERLGVLRAEQKCPTGSNLNPDTPLSAAVSNLKTVTVAPEKSTARELSRIAKAVELSSVGLFDWADNEIKDAQKTAGTSPKVSLAAAKHYRFKGDNVNALIALAKSYPDFSQMFPEEMTREEWEIFYPLTNWKDITYWATQRQLDPFKVAGLIRQESVFNPRARSSANAFGLMQLLLPTAKLVAGKYKSSGTVSSADSLYNPVLNIELGTAYMKDQLERFGRLEYMAAAYNAGPGRVVQWRQTLPFSMDEFVEAIPFRETRMYVQGVVRNTAQYRRLYDENGNFRNNVGSRPLNKVAE